jgi:hypothetical protein
MKAQTLKPTLFWAAFALIEVLGVSAVWLLLKTGWLHPTSKPPMAQAICALLLCITGFTAFLSAFIMPALIVGCRVRVKLAIESAQKNDYERVRRCLSRYLLPLYKYAEIVRILRHLCDDRKTKPQDMSSEFSQYIVLDDWGNYTLSWEGKEKMIGIVDGGFLKAEAPSAKTIKLLMRLAVIIAIIRGVLLIIQMVARK